MPDRVVLLTIPSLAAQDLTFMPNLSGKLADGDRAALAPTFPCLAEPVRANMATGVICGQHGVVADSAYVAERRELEPCPAWREMLAAPPLWQVLREHQPDARSAVCFVSGGRDFGADVECCPQPGPSTALASAFLDLAIRHQPHFLWCEFPHVAAAAERAGPDSQVVQQARRELDSALGGLFRGLEASGDAPPLWLVVSPYMISPVSHVLYPNRVLREARLFSVQRTADGEYVDLPASRAWAIADRQISHIYVAGHDPAAVSEVVRLFRGRRGVAEALAGDERAKYDLLHERSGDVILVSTPDSWQSYAWWPSDGRAPSPAQLAAGRGKLGSDPLELFGEAGTDEAPLCAERVRGSHGAPAADEAQRGEIFASERGVLAGRVSLDTDVCDLVLRQFGI